MVWSVAALRGEIVLMAQVFAGREVPILDENLLQTGNHGPLKPQVRIAPEAESRHAAAIFIAYIQAADIANAAIDDQEFTVIAHIDLDATAQGAYRQKGVDPPARRLQFTQEALVEMKRAHGIEQHSNFDPTACPLSQGLTEQGRPDRPAEK